MTDRYNRDPGDLHFGHVLAEEAPAKKKDDPLEEFLRFAGAIAPAAGTALGMGAGALIGGVAGGGAGAIPGAGLGAGIGGAAGTALGGLATYGADKRAEPGMQAEDERMRREQERAARAQAALQLVG